MSVEVLATALGVSAIPAKPDQWHKLCDRRRKEFQT